MSPLESMWTLITLRPLTLLLLLLLLQPLQLKILHKYVPLSAEEIEQFEDYLEEMRSTGPTLPTPKDVFKRRTIIDPERPLTDSNYCTDEIKMKNVHNRFRCVKEHFFLQISFEELQDICNNLFVSCKNGVKRCHRSRQSIKGVYCNLIEGVVMTDCVYESSYRQGQVLMTCRWQNDIQEVIPAYINDIMEMNDTIKEKHVLHGYFQ
uniref:Inactive ribonuclease-like protein 9 n=1 Tax=Felis catus TaxID=9685 RepID=A0ABI7XVK9_FELCA